MRFKTTVGYVAVVGGDPIDQPDGILVEEPASRFGRGRNRGNLYVLLEISGRATGREALAAELVDTVRDCYYRQRGSITAGLQKAISEANNVLAEENRTSMPGEQRAAGITCAVLRDDDLFIAQAGPAAMYLVHDGQVTRYPDVSPWLDDVAPEEIDATALGDRRDAHVDLFHTPIDYGDAALLVGAGPARSLPPTAWPMILGRPSTAEMLRDLVAASKGSDLSALVLRLEEEEARAAAAPHRQADTVQPPPGPSTWEQISDWFRDLRLGEQFQAVGGVVVTALAGLWAMLLTLLKRMVPDRTSPQPTMRRQTDTVGKSVAKQRSRQKEKATSPRYGDLVQKLLIALAVAIPVVVAGVVLVVVIQRGHSQQVELDALWENAKNGWSQANTTSDQAQVRAYLAEAESYLTQFLARRPDDAQALDLQAKIQGRLDEINQVRRISWVGELKSYPSSADLTRVVVEGAHVFVLDRNGGKVYHHQLDDFQQALKPETADNVLVSKGQQVGSVLVADLVDMVWVPMGEGRQKADLLILESGGNLLEYDPTTGELRPLQVADANLWQFPTLVGSYYGRFYVLDSTANKIWRYQPTVDGYSQAPDEWLTAEVDLLGVVDMAIGNSIYLLYADGNIRKLTAGEPDAFDISDWDTPPRNPSALFTRPPEDTQWVYVADRGNNRIVQCGKDGKFKRQFRLADSETSNGADLLSAVTSLFVDEISGHAFFLSGGKLYIIILPE
jgi:hypothetical protein